MLAQSEYFCEVSRVGDHDRIRGTSREIIESARLLRRKQTPAEDRFWNAVRNKSTYSFRVRRQHAIGNYVLDFWIPAFRIAIEIDGDIHLDDEVEAQDRERSTWLESQDILVLRFTNPEIFDDLESVFRRLDLHIRARGKRPSRDPA